MKRVIPFFAAALLFTGCGEDKAAPSAAQTPPPLPIEVSTVHFATQSYSKTYSAILKPFNEVDVIARVKGYLQAKKFEEGSFVKKGEVLYELQKDEYLAALGIAKANVANAKAALSKASSDWSRAEVLFDKKAISTEQRDAFLFAYDSAKAKLEESQANLKNIELDLNYATISAPISGIAGIKTNDVGAYIEPNTKLTTITANDPVYVEFSLPSDDVSKFMQDVKMGSNVTLLNGSKEYGATIDYIAPKVESSTDTLLLRAKVQNHNNELIIGSFAEVRIDGLKLEHVATIPQASIVKTAEGAMLWVVKDGGVTMNKTDLLMVKDSMAYIQGGVEDGDKVATTNITKIRPNAKVVIVEGK